MALRLISLLLGSVAVFCSVTSAQLARPPHPSQWDILVEAGKGYMHGPPVCHPLGYFSGSPLQFDYDNDLYGLKSDEVHATTDVTQLGIIRGRKVVQITQNVNGGNLVMKRLLVQRTGEEFCAIYQQQYPRSVSGKPVSSATIETINGEPVLETRDPNGNRTVNEAYWTFDAHGPLLLDMKVIDTALKQVLPVGYEARDAFALDIKALCYRSVVWKDDECNACASGGTVTLRLGLQNHQLVVMRKFGSEQESVTRSA
jgi:hypothetical protein